VRDRLFDQALKQDDMFSDFNSGYGPRNRDNYNSRTDSYSSKNDSYSSKNDSYSSKNDYLRSSLDDDWGRDKKTDRDNCKDDSNYAQKNFANAKSISSSQVFGGGDDGIKHRNTNLSKYSNSNSNSISSADYEKDESNFKKRRDYDEDSILGQIVEVTEDLTLLGEGVVEVGSKIADYASEFLEELQDKW